MIGGSGRRVAFCFSSRLRLFPVRKQSSTAHAEIRTDRCSGTNSSCPCLLAMRRRARPIRCYAFWMAGFPLMAFIQENNFYSKRMRPVIIVNVSYGATAYMALRARDFTPTRTPQEANSGGGVAFLDFLEHELISFVDRTWRTIPADRGLLGHSYGGLFAIYALDQRPALFQRIVAASPALSWDNRLLFSAARQKLRELPSPVRLDISVGGKDDFGFDQDTIAFAKLLDELKPAGLDYRFTLYPDENHDSVRLVSLPEGLLGLSQPKNQIPE